MAKSHRKAGENIRKLAAKRKLKAVIAFSAAIFSLVGSIYLSNALKGLTTQLLTITSTSTATTVQQPDFSYLFYIVGFLVATGFVSQGLFLWKRAQHAEQGAEGEEAIAQTLLPLAQEGWQFEYGLMLGKGLGDADIIGLSPKGKGFVIDVKSHGGEIEVQGDGSMSPLR
ncbi:MULTISPECIES: nuclease-related domain-containing protein [unclassified Leptolyngbya]|uniref:nuclease-related domain-containing protein n=1 Tax=unclassified Leptolyngbya TaxID=2650499 RepID=UPI001686F77D|nr:MULTISPECIES: nuclease-related domain-containing protein [unclassified Leptolyngbya]MBD1913268.1 NERD domain-containing protein [Leptolyngbya sp. FACHB-8]MBD2153370.1 NERD domain-containing protein [Leptolyngbya sp. FACHB-16]